MATPQTWQRVKLGDLGTFRNGVNFGKDKKGEGLGLINVKDLFTDSLYIKFETLDKVDLAKKKGINNYYVQEGDLFFSRSSVKRDGVGVVSLARKANNQVVHCGFVIRFRPTSSEIYPLYLTYLLRSDYYRQVIIGISGGSAIINISQDSLGALEIDLPPLPIQRKIAAILSAYDDLIENNTRRIEILEEMARSLYREWFVSFRSETEKVENRTLNDICEFIVDCEHKTAPTQATGYPSIRTPNIGRGRLLLDKVNRVSEETYKAWTKRAIPKEGDLILAREAPVGNVAIIPKNLEVCLGQRTVLIRPDLAKVKPYYLLFLLLSDEIQNKLLSLSNGATVHHLNLKDIRNLGLPELHSMPSQNKINTLLANYYDLIFNLTRKIENLRQTRDLLLPKLISGEINVENFHNNAKEIAA